MHGIEVANGRDYYPESQRWAMEKGLTMLGNTDIHDPISFEYNKTERDYRTMTLVFCTDNSSEGIREALFDRRTAVFVNGSIYGEEKFLKPFFAASIEIVNPGLEIQGKGRAILRIQNKSDMTYKLAVSGEIKGLRFPETVTLSPDATVIVPVACTENGMNGTRKFELPYRVTNLQVMPDKGLAISLPIEITFK